MASESAKQPLQKALRRASRKAFLWPEEASQIVEQGRSLEELAGVGPSLNRIIRRWLDDPPDDVPKPPEISIGTDAHGPSQLRFIELGLASALSAGVKHDRVLNFMSADELLRWVAGVRERSSAGNPAA